MEFQSLRLSRGCYSQYSGGPHKAHRTRRWPEQSSPNTVHSIPSIQSNKHAVKALAVQGYRNKNSACSVVFLFQSCQSCVVESVIVSLHVSHRMTYNQWYSA